MRKASLLIGICMLAAVAIALAAQAPTDLSPIMKDVAATQNKMRMDMMSGNGADVAADAQKLQQDFTQAMGFFKAMKAQDAVDMAKANVECSWRGCQGRESERHGRCESSCWNYSERAARLATTSIVSSCPIKPTR